MKRAAATRTRIARLHGELHRELLELTRPYLEPPIPGFQRYRREYEQDFRETLRSIAAARARGERALRAELRRRLIPEARFRNWARQADLLLIGDFHPFEQASRTALRLLRELHPGDELGCVAIEAFPSSLQPALGAYHRGELSLDALIAEARRNEGDGFPWHHYIPIIETARERGIPVLGLNLPDELNRRFEIPEGRRGSSDLERRDRWASGILCDWWFELAPRGTYPPPPGKSRRALVLYGELHLAESHLPRWIRTVSQRNRRRPPDVRVIQQNHDGLFKAVTAQAPLPQPRAVQVSESMACILGAPPWLKLRSVVRAFESGLADSDLDFTRETEWRGIDEEADEDLAVESAAEYVHRLSHRIAQVWGWKKPSSDHLNVLTELSLEQLLRSTELDRRAQRLLRNEMERGEPVWIPELRAVWTGGLSENDLAESAGWVLLRDRLEGRRAFRPVLERLRVPDAEAEAAWSIAHTFSFLGSLIVNPHRKCDLPGDLQQRIRWLRRERDRRRAGGASARLLATLEFEIASRRRALELLGTGAARGIDADRAESQRFMGARLAGRIVALSLNRRIHEGSIDHEALSGALDSTAASPRDALRIWSDLVALAEPAKLPARKSRW